MHTYRYFKAPLLFYFQKNSTNNAQLCQHCKEIDKLLRAITRQNCLSFASDNCVLSTWEHLLSAAHDISSFSDSTFAASEPQNLVQYVTGFKRNEQSLSYGQFRCSLRTFYLDCEATVQRDQAVKWALEVDLLLTYLLTYLACWFQVSQKTQLVFGSV